MKLRFFAAPFYRFVVSFAIAPLVIASGIFILASSTAVAAEDASTQPGSKRAITEKDLFNFVWIADPQISPDGARTLFTRVITDEKRTGYETSIWIVPTSGNEIPTRLTNGKHDAHARWSPDGKRIAFVRGGEKDDAGKQRPPQIAILSLAGGEARVITDLPKGAASPAWSPDSRRIAFESSTSPEDIEKEQRKKKDAKTGSPKSGESAAANIGGTAAKPEAEDDRESDIHIITRAVYRDNDEGYLDFKRHEHIWLIDVPTTSDEPSKPLQLTSGDFDEGEIVWTHDGSRIYSLTSRIDEPYYETPSTDVYSVASSPKMPGGSPEKLVTVPMGIGDLALSPDGRRIAFHGSVTQPVRSYSQPDLWVMDLTPNADR